MRKNSVIGSNQAFAWVLLCLWAGLPQVLAARQLELPLQRLELEQAALDALCARLRPSCQGSDVRLYEDGSGQSGWRYYLLAVASPQVWVSQQQSFAGARHWAYQAHLRQAPAEELYWALKPVLYRLADGWAWAATSHWSEFYPGGGGHYAVADFVRFDWQTPQRVLYAGVPLHCSRMMRACFTEEDQATSPHCEDEYSGHLRIRQRGRATPENPGWRFVWTSKTWPAFVPVRKASQNTQVLSVQFMPGQESTSHLKVVAQEMMCGGSEFWWLDE
ncbi:MAG: hypothetical protein Q4B94_00830 [Pseudomonadota bacterium]|nr:hypothetical protein [Pseudomonadota bacterium]